MNQYFVILLLILLPKSITSQHISDQAKIQRAYLQGKINNSLSSNVPFTLSRHHKHLLINVIIEDKTYKFMFDTGATLSTIDPVICKKISNSLDSVRIRDSQNNEKFCPISIVPSLKIGSFIISDIAMVQVKPIGYSFCDSISGIIGVNLINKLNWYIDYDKSEITLGSIKFSNSNIRDKVAFYPIGYRPYTRLKIDSNRSVLALIDYGASFNLAINKKDTSLFNISLSKYKGFLAKKGGIFGDSDCDTLKIVQISKITEQRIKLDSVDIIVASDQYYIPVIGHELLRKYNIGIDNVLKEIYFYERKRDNQQIKKSYFPINIEYKDSKFFINFTKLYSKATNYNLKCGDEIASVNGKTYNDFSDSCNFDEWFESQNLIEIRTKKGQFLQFVPEE